MAIQKMIVNCSKCGRAVERVKRRYRGVVECYDCKLVRRKGYEQAKRDRIKKLMDQLKNDKKYQSIIKDL